MRLPSPALLISCLALFVALGGIGFAAATLPRNSVGTKQLKANAVNGSKVANNSLKGADIDESSLSGIPYVPAPVATGDLLPDLPSGAGTTVWASQAVTLAKPARVLVLARMTPFVQCDVIPCEATYYVTVDDVPLANTQARVTSGPFATSIKDEVTTMGVTGVLAAGSHTVKLVHVASSAQASSAGGRVLSAVAVG